MTLYAHHERGRGYRHFMDPHGAMELVKGGWHLDLSPEVSLKDTGVPPLWPFPHPQSRNCFSFCIHFGLLVQTVPVRPIRQAALRYLWPSRRVTVENFSWGPVGKTGSGAGSIGSALENPVQSGPRSIHLVGQYSVQMELSSGRTPDAQQPQTPNPLTLL